MKAQSLLSGVVGFGILVYFFGAGSEHLVAKFNKDVELRADEFDKSIKEKVAKDAMEQLIIVIRNGNPADACVYAGFTSAALLQAKREADYQQIKTMEGDICRKAGLR
jgi:hypothetical protein